MSNSELRIARPDWNGPGKPPVVKELLLQNYPWNLLVSIHPTKNMWDYSTNRFL